MSPTQRWAKMGRFEIGCRDVSEQSFIVMGEIVGVHGVRGGVKVRSYAEIPDVFKPDMPIYLGDEQGVREPHIISWITPHKKILLMGLRNVTDRSAAVSLVGGMLYVPKDVLPVLEEGTYYWFELIGLAVFTTGNQYLGQVESIMRTGSNDVLIVKDFGSSPQREVLIPALESVIEAVNPGEKTMRVKLPEGLA